MVQSGLTMAEGALGSHLCETFGPADSKVDVFVIQGTTCSYGSANPRPNENQFTAGTREIRTCTLGSIVLASPLDHLMFSRALGLLHFRNL